MKNGKLILTSENIAMANYETLKMVYGGQDGSKEFFNIVDLLKDASLKYKQIQSCLLPETSTLLLVRSFKKGRKVYTQTMQIALPKVDKLANKVLLLIARFIPEDLFYKAIDLVFGGYETLTYNYIADFDKNTNEDEINSVSKTGILK